MTSKQISKKVLIDKPFKTFCRFYTLGYCEKKRVLTTFELIEFVKKNNDCLQKMLGYNGMSNMNCSNIYIEHKGYLFGLQEDKSFRDIVSQLKKHVIIFDYFYVPGGASREHQGYCFIVHPDESVHKFSPHVHVKKNGVSPRYSLTTFRRFSNDKYTRDHIRDEKKIIVPFLKKNRDWFYSKWDLYMKGYIPPIETENGQQICKES